MTQEEKKDRRGQIREGKRGTEGAGRGKDKTGV